MARKTAAPKAKPAPMRIPSHIAERVGDIHALLGKILDQVLDPAITGNDRLILLTVVSRELSAARGWDGGEYTRGDRLPIVKQISDARTDAIVESIERLGTATAVAEVVGMTPMAVHQALVRHAGKPVTKKPRPAIVEAFEAASAPVIVITADEFAGIPFDDEVPLAA
ncbi:hypothetical protein BJ973_004008 [Actinoplanes tereljensis]|uniref:Uncharacterized protein n=1 Tax=Paractinoplanes tereljensis TaxID=571912 RepID=A0A919NVY6_9ACTN|nr:hypothetical protein [Actinoplanes tereljensis]GIF25733.1 hypothetical protein Ate02nite_84630 [Actinoplanes tereljensis]